MTRPARARTGPSEPRRARSIHVEDLIGAAVVDATGKRVGRVVDAEVRPKEEWEVVALVLGRFGFLDRFDTLRAFPYRVRGFGDELVVAWSDVASLDERTVRLRAGARPRRASEVVRSGTAGERGAEATARDAMQPSARRRPAAGRSEGDRAPR